MNDSPNPPDAMLFIAPDCPHCPAVLASLNTLLKDGDLGRLQAVNIHSHPEQARELGIRSVPWLRIGTFELNGLHSLGELREWARHARSGSGMRQYLGQLLENRQLPQATEMVRSQPELIAELVELVGDLQTPMAIRIGVGAVFEDLSATPAMAHAVPGLGALIRSGQVQVRADAAHYLGLCGTAEAKPLLQSLLNDPDAEVREIAGESLETLQDL